MKISEKFLLYLVGVFLFVAGPLIMDLAILDNNNQLLGLVGYFIMLGGLILFLCHIE